jgi:hypothetical protein
MKIPPSLNKMRGLSDVKLEERNRFERLRDVIADLQGAKPHEPYELAERLLDVYHQARGQVRRKRKDGSASPTEVHKQLLNIQKGSETLLARLTKADTNVFDAWAASSGETTEDATERWLQLKQLLACSFDTSRKASDAAAVVAKRPPGRKEDGIANCVSAGAMAVYTAATGKKPGRTQNRDDIREDALFPAFLGEVFEILAIKANVDFVIRTWQDTLNTK